MEATNITLLGRTQWLGISGAPNTGTLSASGYIGAIKSGIGGTIIFDKLGPLQTMGGLVSYAFHASFSDRIKLNIGIEGGFYSKSLNPGEDGWIYSSSGGVDPVVGAPNMEYKQSAFVPDLGAGIYFHILRDGLQSTAYPQDLFYLGISAAHLLEPKIDNLLMTSVGGSRVPRGLDFTVGGSAKLGRNIYLAPSAFFRTDLASYQLDITVNCYISPMVFGVAYRGNIFSNNPNNNKKFFWNNDSVDGMIGFNANTNLFIGYAYDFAISGLRPHTSGSHELIVSYTFPNLSRIIAPVEDVRGRPE